MRTFHDIEQNTEEWMAMRLGRFTASMFGDLFMGKTTKGYEKAVYTPVYERLTGEAPENFQSDYMKRGHELEPAAVEFYESEEFVSTTNGGFWTLGEWLGASPDRMTERGVLEVKCPAFNTMMNYLMSGKVPGQYKWQIHGQMYITDTDECHFMAYHPKLKPLILNVKRDEKIEKELIEKLNESIEKAIEILEKLKCLEV